MDLRKRSVFAVLAVALWAASPAAAVDGVIEINQARAAAGGVSPADAPGFPVDITESGSYRLTSNLVSSSYDSVIRVTADHVTLDLNGFEMVGPNSCTTTSPMTCTYFDGFGVDGLEAEGTKNFTVKNGTVRGAVSLNISCGVQCRVLDVTVREAVGGISTSGGSVVRGSTAMLHYAYGISTYTGTGGSIVTGNVASQNGADGGIILGIGDRAVNNVAGDNLGHGFTSSGGTLIGNSARNNGGSGFYAFRGVLTNNSAFGNAGHGLHLATSNEVGYSGNVFSDNASGTVSGTGVQLGPNLCGTDTTCP